jgi:hypothetical protein
MKAKNNDELTVAEAIVSVLPDGSVARVCSDDRENVRFAVRADGMKLRSIVLRRESLQRLQSDATATVKIEYLQRDLLRSATRRTEFRYPRAIRAAARKMGKAKFALASAS